MHPILFQTRFFTVHIFWLFITIGIIVGSYTLIKLSIRNGLKIQFLSDITFKLILFTIIGARVVSLIVNFQSYFYEFSSTTIFKIFYIWDKGINFYGALIGFFAYLFYACRKNEQNFLKWLDAIIPALILGVAFGHLGAFFEGINYGHETSLPWGVNFESPWIKYTVPIHPTQIYAFIYSAVISIGLIMINNLKSIKNRNTIGLIGLGGIQIYSFLRFLEGFMRGDDTLLIFGIRLPQIISLLVIIGSGIFLYFRYNKLKQESLKKPKNANN
ncbi:prolipoprotein diacylglyceryl transferase [Patescibacteria group bacterium]